MRRPPRCPRSDTLCPYTTLFRSRGRSERSFRTLQDRLPKELALAGITTVAAANRWLAETYIPQHNAAFAVTAEQDRSEEHTSELQSLMRISYAVFCLKKKNIISSIHRYIIKPNLKTKYKLSRHQKKPRCNS